MPERSHLSIGEVLSLLREEFPDVTISKIRFLESQGLVDPERTPSGYRKFYDHDVERLRWILQQQREHFLPLKVIRGRLSEHPEDVEHEAGAEAASPTGTATPSAPSGPDEDATSRPAVEASHGGVGEPGAGAAPGGAAAAAGNGGGAAAPAGAPTGARAAPAAEDAPAGEDAPAEEADAYTLEELATRSGASPALIADLRQYGLVAPQSVVAGVAYFAGDAVRVARAAAGLARHGVEARHLRPWRNAADREAALFEQVVMPLLRQRNPQARREAAAALEELTRLGGQLREVLVHQALRDVR